MKIKFSYLFLLLLAIKIFGQVTLVPITEGENFRVNKKFKLTFVLEIKGDNYIQETPLQLPDFSKFNIIGSASDQHTYGDPSSNYMINQIVYQLVLEPKQIGNFKIGSARVIVNGKPYTTEAFDITVNEADKKTVSKTKIPNNVYLSLEVENKQIYTNQPTIALLKAYSKDFENLRKVKNIQVSKQENINFKAVNYDKSEIEPDGDMASQTIAVYMIFPNESGNIEVKPISASVKLLSKDTKITSNRVKLNVKRLPSGSPENYKNAVGNFELSMINNSVGDFEVEKPINVTVKLSGEGNFGTIVLPKIQQSEDYLVYAPKITNQTLPTEDGIKGAIFANYVIIPRKTGPISIQTENFSFFNPTDKNYVDLGRKIININTLTHDDILETKSTLEKVNEYSNHVLETVSNPVIEISNLQSKTKSEINWKAWITNISLFFAVIFALIIFRNRKRKIQIKNENTTQKLSGSIADKEKEIREELKTDIGDYFAYLKKQKDNNDSEGFFKTVDEINLEIRKKYFQNNESDFNKFAENLKGAKFAEELRKLSQKIQMEKYTPLHTTENINELYEEIIKLYSQISK